MNNDIVARLRVFTKTLLLGDFQGLAATTESAADEIEWLRKERDEAEPLLNELWERRTETTDIRSEIERLRKELDTRIAMCDMRSERIIELEGIIDSSLDDIPSLQASIDSMSDEITMLVKERDEARRLYCRAVEEIEHGMTNETERMVADYLGWDCFKEEADHNNKYFRTHHK